MFFLPTWRRPDRLRALLPALVGSKGVVIVNGKPWDGYDGIDLPDGWSAEFLEENRGFCGALNRALEQNPGLPWYGHMTDDAVPITEGWGEKIPAAAMRFGMASAFDGWMPQRQSSLAAWRGDVLRAAGAWYPSGLWHWYADDVWETIGRTLGIWQILPDVRIEHRHRFNNLAPDDATYQSGSSRKNEDRARFERWKAEEMPGVLERVSAVMGRPIDMTRAAQRSVAIATPFYEGADRAYVQSLVSTVAKLTAAGIHAEYLTCRGSFLPKARAALLAQFMTTGLDDLVFIDADMGWEPMALARLLASPQEVIAGAGRKKNDRANIDPSAWAVDWLPGSEKRLVRDDRGAVAVSAVGGAFLKIARTAVEKLIAAHPELMYRADDLPPDAQRYACALFNPIVDDGRWLAEDFSFCKRWRDIGGTVYVDPKIVLSHFGARDHRGALMEALQCSSSA